VTRRPAALSSLIGRAALASALLFAVAVPPVAAADIVAFGKPEADSAFGRSIEFDQPVELTARPERVEILLASGDAAGPSIVETDPPAAGKSTLHFGVDLSAGHVVPNTTFTARWRVTATDGTVSVGPALTHTYADDRIDWQTLNGDTVRVHWSEGGDAFGRRALTIGDTAVRETAALLGVTESDPIDFYIYANQGQFYDALGPGTRENVGGEAHSDIRTMFALITPNEIDDTWVDIVVPHELSHLVFATAIDNPYHEPPHWLNEGLAVYLSEGFSSSDRDLVDRVARDGTIIPLEGLAGAFPTTRDRFFLAYAESTSAVDFMVKQYGREALIGLIRSYATGVTDDEAFTAAIGLDTAQFEAAWLASLGAGVPARHGPQPAPAGPVPESWGGAAPAPSVGPVTTGAPVTPPSNAPGAPGESGSLVMPLLLLLLAAAVVGGAVLLRRRSGGAQPPQSPLPPPPTFPPTPPSTP
jgi:hypothetical protein